MLVLTKLNTKNIFIYLMFVLKKLNIKIYFLKNQLNIKIYFLKNQQPNEYILINSITKKVCF